jgi:hypothetical protein
MAHSDPSALLDNAWIELRDKLAADNPDREPLDQPTEEFWKFLFFAGGSIVILTLYDLINDPEVFAIGRERFLIESIKELQEQVMNYERAIKAKA